MQVCIGSAIGIVTGISNGTNSVTGNGSDIATGPDNGDDTVTKKYL